MGILRFIFNRILDIDDIDDIDDDLNIMDSYGELTTVAKGNDIPFTGLIDKGLENCEVYKSWLDGVEPGEIEAEDIQEIVSHIADEFSQALPDVKIDWSSSGFATSMNGNGTIFYDIASVMKDSVNGYGADNIVGSIAHEMGHNIVERVFSGTGTPLTRLQHEIGADYMEGVVFGMSGINPKEKFAWLHSMNTSSPNYLSTEGRIDVIEQGIEWGERLRFIGEHAPELMVDAGSNEVLRGVLKNVMGNYTDII